MVGLSPVYSAEKNRIYKNTSVALCHNVKDGQPWEAVVVCERGIGAAGSADVLTDLDKFLLFCSAEFLLPVSLNELIEHRCYQDLTDVVNGKCKPLYKTILENSNLNLTEEELIEACINGPLSPIRRARKVFRNAFCTVCSGYSVNHELSRDLCYTFDNDTSAKSPDNTFTFLISTDRVTTYVESRENVDTLIACRPNEKVNLSTFLLNSLSKFKIKTRNKIATTFLYEPK